MLILSVNKILKWCQITADGRTYTCPTEIIDNVLHFKFKNHRYKVSEYVGEYTTELVEKNGRIILEKFMK